MKKELCCHGDKCNLYSVTPVLFKIDINKINTQNHNSKEWSFCNNDLVIQYVKIMKPMNLIVSSLAFIL